MSILDRYATSIRSSNLRSDPRTTCSDSDVLGAAGLAGKRHGRAMMLQRLYLGDNGAAGEVLAWLADEAAEYAGARRIRIKFVRCVDIARAVLAWHRHGVCGACHGHGYRLIPGTPALSGDECPECRGSGRVPFEPQFAQEHRGIAGRLQSLLDAEMSAAAPAIMQALSREMDL